MIRAMCAPISQNCKKGRSRASDGPPFFHEGTRCFCRTQFCRKMRRCRSRWFIAEHSVAAERSSAGKRALSSELRAKILLRTKMSRGKGLYLCGGVPHRQDFICAGIMPPRASLQNFKKFLKKIAEKQGVFLFFA